jgi:ribonuclease HII
MAPPRDDRRLRDALRRRERELRRAGYRHVAGADEAGAGPLAGPLVAGAVILPAGARLPGVRDSKALTPARRLAESERIRAVAIAWSVHEAPAARVDEIGPLHAAIEAMAAAVCALDPAPDYLLVDARPLPGLDIPQEPVVGGDALHLSIAAASILAKVHRDGTMAELDRRYPGYGFAEHKGYGTATHLDALERLGPCAEHRRRYAPVARCLPAQGRLFGRRGGVSGREESRPRGWRAPGGSSRSRP